MTKKKLNVELNGRLFAGINKKKQLFFINTFNPSDSGLNRSLQQ